MNNEEESKLSKLLNKLGINTAALINNSIVEFLVDRYVNWSTESQRLFRRVMSVFTIFIVVFGIFMIYITTIEKHQSIDNHNVMFQMLKKYTIKKKIYEKRLSSLQAGRGDVVKSMNANKVISIIKKNEISEDNITVSSGDPEKTAGFHKKEFTVEAKKVTYPQLIQSIYDVEALGTNVHIGSLDITQNKEEKGLYAFNFKLTVFEPIVGEQAL
jgi:hypothetical protein